MTFLKHHWPEVVILVIVMAFHIADRSWPFGWLFDAGRWA